MDNVFYFKRINKIGGTEQFLYEIAKGYQDYDITIYYDDADGEQINRISKYARCKKIIKGEKIKCKKVFFNYNIDAITNVEAEHYYFISHGIYQELNKIPPIENEKLTDFIAVSNYAKEKLQEFAKKLHRDIEIEVCYNPISKIENNKCLLLVSACRLNDRVKGGQRTLKLIEELDRYCEKNETNYLWLIFTNDVNFSIASKNVVLMKPRTDVRPYIAKADYVLQLSNDMETYCYTINEALLYGVPIVTTPLTILNELSITDNEHITLDWDCQNIKEVVKMIFEKEVKNFIYEPPKTRWNEILVKGENKYKEERKMIKKSKVIKEFTLERFSELNNIIRADEKKAEEGRLYVNDIFESTSEIQDYLLGQNKYNKAFVEDITIKKEEEKTPVKKTTTRKSKTKSKSTKK